MTRQRRRQSDSNVYHVMIRGAKRFAIFKEESDYDRFLTYVFQAKEQSNVKVLAYCLMTNHVHLLLYGKSQDVSVFMQKVQSRYAIYFNSRFSEVGHVFQGRFRSEPVDDEAYYNTVLRYVIRNPDEAGLAQFDVYPWSSYPELLRLKPQTVTDVDKTLELLGKKQLDKDFFYSKEQSQKVLLDDLDPESQDRKTLTELLNGTSIEEMGLFDKPVRDEVLRKAKEQGISVRRLSAITGISRDVISRA